MHFKLTDSKEFFDILVKNNPLNCNHGGAMNSATSEQAGDHPPRRQKRVLQNYGDKGLLELNIWAKIEKF